MKKRQCILSSNAKNLKIKMQCETPNEKWRGSPLGGMLLYPFAVVCASLADLDQAQKTLGDMLRHTLSQSLVLSLLSLVLRLIQRNDRQRSHNSQDITHISLG